MENGHNPRNINDIKYAMFIFWKRIGKKAVVIGQNPSKAYNNYALDGTNQNIVKILKKKGYSGYLMLNTFPKIDPNGKSISNITKNKKNIKLSKKILKFFCTKILACSENNNIDFEYYNEILSKNKFKVVKVNQRIISHFAPIVINTKGGINNISKGPLVEIKIDATDKKPNNNTCKISMNLKK